MFIKILIPYRLLSNMLEFYFIKTWIFVIWIHFFFSVKDLLPCHVFKRADLSASCIEYIFITKLFQNFWRSVTLYNLKLVYSRNTVFCKNSCSKGNEVLTSFLVFLLISSSYIVLCIWTRQTLILLTFSSCVLKFGYPKVSFHWLKTCVIQVSGQWEEYVLVRKTSKMESNQSMSKRWRCKFRPNMEYLGHLFFSGGYVLSISCMALLNLSHCPFLSVW